MKHHHLIRCITCDAVLAERPLKHHLVQCGVCDAVIARWSDDDDSTETTLVTCRGCLKSQAEVDQTDAELDSVDREEEAELLTGATWSGMFLPHPDDRRELLAAVSECWRRKFLSEEETYAILDAGLGEKFPRPS